MGCAASSTASSPADELSEKTSKSIDKLLREDEKRLAREVKVSLSPASLPLSRTGC